MTRLWRALVAIAVAVAGAAVLLVVMVVELIGSMFYGV